MYPRSFANSVPVAVGVNAGTDRHTFLIGATGVFGCTALPSGNNASSGTLTANTWWHGCGVWASNTSRTAYLNGVAGSTATNAYTGAGGWNTITVGGRWATTFGGYFNGIIAEVGIWNAALTAAEIASLADGMTCDKVRPQSLVFYAPLCRDLIDVKGGLTITNNNTATVANHPRVYA
jgi:hypothetical protein